MNADRPPGDPAVAIMLIAVFTLVSGALVLSGARAPYADAPDASYASEPGGAFSVPMRTDYAGMHVGVRLGRGTYTMLVDSGASISVIPTSIATALLSSKEASPNGSGPVILADGSSREVRFILVHRLTIGGRTIRGVAFAVEGDRAELLLGANVLNQFGRFSVDLARGRLIFG